MNPLDTPSFRQCALRLLADGQWLERAVKEHEELAPVGDCVQCPGTPADFDGELCSHCAAALYADEIFDRDECRVTPHDPQEA